MQNHLKNFINFSWGVLIFMHSRSAIAQNFGGGAFESKIQGVTSAIVSVVLPAVSALGLIYAAILAASGDQGAKNRIALVIGTSVVGFLAPVIISWIKAAAG